MALALGVDTGGTYTDAVLIRDQDEVIASAKSLTTRADLALGVSDAIRAVLDASGVAPGDIALAALSTTLATNALVEGQGGRVGLIYVGFAETDLDRHGLSDALKGDPALVVAGGHTHAGTEAAPLDMDAIAQFLETHRGRVSGWAVAAQFATRNPAHELAVAEAVTRITGAPVTASHDLSARLNGPKRAVTAVLNARLIGMIHRLIGRAEDALVDLGIHAPLMVVRGDGALMSAPQAKARPIETILSGPAASIVGARWLTGAQDALVSDIGGTTTDVALLRGGRPAIDPQGAKVGAFRTMVEAVAMRTTGLGGDSEVHVQTGGLQGGLTLGPRRVLPVALAAQMAPDVVHAALDAALRSELGREFDGRFVPGVAGMTAEGLSERDAALLARIGDELHPMNDVLRNRMDLGGLKRLVDRGLVQVSAVTPSDAAHVLGRLDAWDGSASHKALTLLARRRIGSGERLAPGAEPLAQMIIDQLTQQTGAALLEAAFAEDPAFDDDAAYLARHVLLRAGLGRHRGLLALDAALNVDVVGLGASAPSYYPAVGDHLNCRMILPEHAGVANAIGAVVGRITQRRSGQVTSPAEGKFRVHLDTGPEDFADPDAALARIEAVLTTAARDAVSAAGADDIRVTADRQIRSAQVEAREVFVEATVTVEASGRPRIAV